MVSAYIVLDLGMAVAAHKHWSSPWRVGAHRYVGRHQPCECGVSRRMFGAAMSIHVLGPSIRVFTPFRCRNGVGRLYASHSPRSVRLGCIAPVGGALVLASILHSGGLTCDGALSSAMRLWPTSVWRAHRIWWWMILAPIFLGEPRLCTQKMVVRARTWRGLHQPGVGCHPPRCATSSLPGCPFFGGVLGPMLEVQTHRSSLAFRLVVYNLRRVCSSPSSIWAGPH